MSIHENAFELLPWYINGTLNAAEMTLVESHLAQCEICAGAVEDEMQIARQIQPRSEDVRRIAELETSRNASYQGLKAQLTAKQNDAAKTLARVGFAAMALTAAITIGFALRPDEPSFYTPMTQSSPADESHVVLQLAFHPATTENQMRNLLIEVGGTVTGPPSRSGIYRITLNVDTEPLEMLSFLETHPAVRWVTVEQ